MSVTLEQALLDKLLTRGYWRVVIRPTTIEEKHIPNYSDLFSIVEKNSVRLRSWGYPHVDYQCAPLTGRDWVGQEFDRDCFIEVWRLYLSAQFIQFCAIAGDWRDQSRNWPAHDGWAPGKYLNYLDTIYQLVEIFEFAARLALSPAGAVSMRVEIQLHGLQGRQLIETDSAFRFSQDYSTQMPEWNHRWEGSQTDVIAWPRKLAAEAARDLFARFGLDLSLEGLARNQARIGR